MVSRVFRIFPKNLPTTFTNRKMSSKTGLKRFRSFWKLPMTYELFRQNSVNFPKIQAWDKVVWVCNAFSWHTVGHATFYSSPTIQNTANQKPKIALSILRYWTDSKRQYSTVFSRSITMVLVTRPALYSSCKNCRPYKISLPYSVSYFLFNCIFHLAQFLRNGQCKTCLQNKVFLDFQIATSVDLQCAAPICLKSIIAIERLCHVGSYSSINSWAKRVL